MIKWSYVTTSRWLSSDLKPKTISFAHCSKIIEVKEKIINGFSNYLKR